MKASASVTKPQESETGSEENETQSADVERATMKRHKNSVGEFLRLMADTSFLAECSSFLGDRFPLFCFWSK